MSRLAQQATREFDAKQWSQARQTYREMLDIVNSGKVDIPNEKPEILYNTAITYYLLSHTTTMKTTALRAISCRIYSCRFPPTKQNL